MSHRDFYTNKNEKLSKLKENIESLGLENLDINKNEILKNVVALGDFSKLLKKCAQISQTLREINDYGIGGDGRYNGADFKSALPTGMFTAWKLAREKDNQDHIVACKLHVYSDSSRCIDSTSYNEIHVNHSKITNIYDFDKNTKEITKELNSSKIQLVSFYSFNDLIINAPYYGESWCGIDLYLLINNLIPE